MNSSEKDESTSANCPISSSRKSPAFDSSSFGRVSSEKCPSSSAPNRMKE